MRFQFDVRKSKKLRGNPNVELASRKLWKLKNTRKTRKPIAAESVARLADQGKDFSRFFTNSGRMVAPIQRVNVDVASPMSKELDIAASELNVSRQALIKTLLRQALDQRYLARHSHPGTRRSR